MGLHPTPDQGGLLVLSKTSMLSCQLDIPISRSKRPLAFALGCSKTPLTELKAPWALSVLMLSRQTLVPDSTDAISASMPSSRNERKCPAATPRGGVLLWVRCQLLFPKELCMSHLSRHESLFNALLYFYMVTKLVNQPVFSARSTNDSAC